MPDQLKNFAITVVAAAPSPAVSGTSLNVPSGHGARFPVTPFMASIGPVPSGTDPFFTPANAEIVRVSSIATDTLTIARAQEGTTARTVLTGDVITASITKRVLDELAASTYGLITQASHGLAVGDAVRLSGTSYVKAKADNEANAEVIGIVSAVPDANTFSLTAGGRITGLTGLTAGTVYYLSAATAGALTATEPAISKPLLIADTTTTGWFVNMRGLIGGGSGGGGTPLSTVKAIRAANQSIANATEVPIQFNEADEFDTDGYHDPASNNTRITIPAGKGGLYLLVGETGFASTGTTGDRAMYLKKNGTTYIHTVNHRAGANFGTSQQIVGFVELVPGDYVEFPVYQNNGSSQNVSDSKFFALLISASGGGAAADDASLILATQVFG